ncbi:hypothetical protein [Streptomyces sp. NPDC021020]|uniref:hypothetical protein n=1 Tax=Streptomyces sp. NPDC021020 TaxID=3365109 RepID=UPI00379C4DE8
MTTPEPGIRAASAPDLSADPRRRVGDYMTMQVNARMRIFAALAAVKIEPDEADQLVCAVKASAVAGGHSWVEEQCELAPDEQGEAYRQGWDGAITAATNTLVSTADSVYRQRGRAHTTSALMKFAEIVHRHQQTDEKAGQADSVDVSNTPEAGV